MTQDLARITFAKFSPRLKAAMKGAAIRNSWCKETWPMQIELVFDALRRGAGTEVLADAYSTELHDDLV